jgi:hypothetical protein
MIDSLADSHPPSLIHFMNYVPTIIKKDNSPPES